VEIEKKRRDWFLSIKGRRARRVRKDRKLPARWRGRGTYSRKKSEGDRRATGKIDSGPLSNKEEKAAKESNHVRLRERVKESQEKKAAERAACSRKILSNPF